MSVANGIQDALVVAGAVSGGVLGYVLWLGFQKAVVDRAAERLFRNGANRLLEAMPAVFQLADVMMPQKEAGSTGEELAGWIEGILEQATGDDWGTASASDRAAAVDQFFLLYDPRIGADRRTRLGAQGLAKPPTITRKQAQQQ